MARRGAEVEENYTFFVDACLGMNRGRGLPAALVAAGATIECLTEHFAKDALDETWLPFAGERGWAVLTKDKFILRRQNELEALRNAGVGAFVLSSGKLSGDAVNAVFVIALPRMLRTLRAYARGDGYYFIARVTSSGEVEVIEGTRRGAIKRDR